MVDALVVGQFHCGHADKLPRAVAKFASEVPGMLVYHAARVLAEQTAPDNPVIGKYNEIDLPIPALPAVEIISNVVMVFLLCGNAPGTDLLNVSRVADQRWYSEATGSSHRPQSGASEKFSATPLPVVSRITCSAVLKLFPVADVNVMTFTSVLSVRRRCVE